MKKIIVLLLVLSMLLLAVSCGKTDSTANGQNADGNVASTDSATGKEDDTATEEPENEDALIEMAEQVISSLAYGKVDEADMHTLYSHEEQWNLLFPDSEGPQEYYGYTFENMDDLAGKVISLLIVSENEDFTITVTDASVNFYTDGNYAEIFADTPESKIVPIGELKIEKAAKVILSLVIESGEEATSSMEVYFVKIDGQWKVLSPTIAGFFLDAFTPTQIETVQ